MHRENPHSIFPFRQDAVRAPFCLLVSASSLHNYRHGVNSLAPLCRYVMRTAKEQQRSMLLHGAVGCAPCATSTSSFLGGIPLWEVLLSVSSVSLSYESERCRSNTSRPTSVSRVPRTCSLVPCINSSASARRLADPLPQLLQ